MICRLIIPIFPSFDKRGKGDKNTGRTLDRRGDLSYNVCELFKEIRSGIQVRPLGRDRETGENPVQCRCCVSGADSILCHWDIVPGRPEDALDA